MQDGNTVQYEDSRLNGLTGAVATAASDFTNMRMDNLGTDFAALFAARMLTAVATPIRLAAFLAAKRSHTRPHLRRVGPTLFRARRFRDKVTPFGYPHTGP